MTKRPQIIVIDQTELEARALQERLGDAYEVHRAEASDDGEAQAMSAAAKRQARESAVAKDEALARLAGHVAHDLNNWLTVLVAQTSRLKGLPGTPGEVGASLEQALGRGRALAQELRGLVPRGTGGRTQVDLDALVTEALAPLLLPGTGSVAVHHLKATGGAVVTGDGRRLRAMLDELLSNGVRAMPQGGDLTVTIATRTIDAAFAEDHPPLEPGLCVVLSVADSGIGMDAHTLSHIFEPYFAAGEGRRGSGLGLPTARSAALEHGGAVIASSTPGKGTRIDVVLPAAGSTTSSSARPHAPRHLLLIDELSDTALPSLQLLAEAGFQASVFDDPLEAIERFRRAPEAFHAVVTDPVFTDMPAPELVRELRAVRSSVPIIAAPRRGERVAPEELLRQGFDSVLVKPWRLDEAVAVLSRATAPPAPAR